MGYSESYRTGYETSGRGGQNPFKGALNEIIEARKRREAEDLKRQDEDRRLHDLFAELDKRSDLDIEKEYAKGEIEGNLKRKPLGNTPVASIPNTAMSLADGGVGDMQGNKIAEGVVQKAGLKSPRGVEYEQVDSPKRLLEHENLKYMQNINKSMNPDSGISGGDNLIYRRADTGEEVSKEIAEQEIAKGNKNYIVNKVSVSKSGIKETPVVTTQDRKFTAEQEENEKINQEKAKQVLDTANDTLKTIADVEEGINNFGPLGNVWSIPGTKRRTWESNVDKLLSVKILDTIKLMKDASKTGATGFGSLNIEELNVLKNASTALKKDLPKEDAQRYINDMKRAVSKIIARQSGESDGISIPSGQTSSGIKFTIEE